MNRREALGIAALAAGAWAWAQDVAPDRLKASFRDPSRPGTVRVNVMRGSITVKGYAGQEVIVEARTRPAGGKDDGDAAKEPGGLRRIMNRATGLTIEEENNVMQIGTQSHRHAVDVVVQVPLKTSLKLHALNSGKIEVDGVEGELEVDNINGAVTLTNVSGSVVAHALNGALTAVLRKAEAGKSMSFSSLNGKIDVTLPADLKANLRMQSTRGEIYSDFDIALGAQQVKLDENKRDGDGKYRVSTEAGVAGKINGGGPEITFKNMNGSIYIRKGK